MATIHGTNGHDRADLGGVDLIGTSGNDTIFGYGGEDLLSGGDGHDVLDVGSGIYNTARGGAGDDVILSDGRSWFDGGAGQDMMIFRSGASGRFNLGEGWGAFGPAATDRFTMMNFESIVTGAGADTITGSELRNVITAGGGADVVLALGGNDVVYGGLGNDALDGGAGADDLRGQDGDDQLNGGSGNDSLDGGNGHDLLWGGSGDDIVTGGRGNDTLDGGESGYDTASYAGHSASISVDMLASRASSTVNGVTEIDELFRIDKVIGSSFADKLYAGATTALDGGAGDDILWSGSGANALTGGEGFGRDMVSYARSTAGVAVDLLAETASGGWATGDTFLGIEGLGGSQHADTLKLSNGGGRLEGNGGNDLLYGGARGDVIDGGHGYDQMWGGRGADTFVFSATSHSSPGPDWIRDFNLDEGDRIDLSRIDADSRYRGDQAFSKLIFAGEESPGWSTDFRAGTIGVSVGGGDTYLHFNTIDQSSNAAQHDPAEMIVKLTGYYHELTLDSFIL